MGTVGPSGGKIPDSSGPNHNKKATCAGHGRAGGKSFKNITANAQIGAQVQVAPMQPASVAQAKPCDFSATQNPSDENAKKMAGVAQTIFRRQ